MLLVKQWTVFFFLTLIALISSTSNNQTNCTRQFEFPNLKDSQHIISAYSNENISVEFSVNSTCSTHFTGIYTILDKEKQICAFLRQNGNCENYSDNKYCRCPEEGSDLYRMEIPAGKGNNTIWTWRSVPSLVKEHKIHIVILDGTASDRTDGSTSNTPATNNVHMQISTLENIDTQDSEATDSKTTTATVATCTAIITAVIVTIAWIVVYRYKTKVTIRRRLGPHDLALQEIQNRNQQPPHSPPAQPQQQQRLLPEIPGQYQVPCSVPASSGQDARRSVDRMSHAYEVVGGDQEGEVPEVLKTELPDTKLHPRPLAQEMTAPQASKPGIGNGLYFHIHPNK